MTKDIDVAGLLEREGLAVKIAALVDERLVEQVEALTERLAAMEREVERKHQAYLIAFGQAMENGSNLMIARAENERKDAALSAARCFISNGVDYGFIRMPESEDDPAHNALPLIYAALSPKGGQGMGR